MSKVNKALSMAAKVSYNISVLAVVGAKLARVRMMDEDGALPVKAQRVLRDQRLVRLFARPVGPRLLRMADDAAPEAAGPSASADARPAPNAV